MTQTTTIKIASITSGPAPQKGQSHRSSGNFAVETIPPNTTALLWTISGNPNADRITFNVMKDISVGKDPTVFPDVSNGHKTKLETARSFYIADPRQANGKDFTVTVSAITG